MRRAGRIAGSSQHHAEAVWAAGALVFAVVFISAIAVLGAKPPEGLALEPAPAPVIIAGGSPAERAELVTLKQRVDAAESEASAAKTQAADASKQQTAEAAELAQVRAALAAAKAKATAEATARQQAETELTGTKDKLAQAVQAEQRLEAEISSWEKSSKVAGDNATSGAQALKRFQATLAKTQVQLAQAQQEAASEAKQRAAMEAQLRESQARVKEQDEALQTQANASRSEAAQLHRATAQLAVAAKREANLEQQSRAAEAQAAAAEAKAAAAAQGGQAPVIATGMVASLCDHTLIVFALGVAGFFSVLGPSSFVHVFLPVAASWLGAWVGAGAIEWLAPSTPSSFTLLDSMSLLINGGGGWFGYFLWLMLLTMGIMRWIHNIECSLWDVVEEVNMGEGKEPLLNAEDNAPSV